MRKISLTLNAGISLLLCSSVKKNWGFVPAFTERSLSVDWKISFSQCALSISWSCPVPNQDHGHVSSESCKNANISAQIGKKKSHEESWGNWKWLRSQRLFVSSLVSAYSQAWNRQVELKMSKFHKGSRPCSIKQSKADAPFSLYKMHIHFKKYRKCE